MAPNISENLSSIKRSASELNQLADEATEQIRALSKFLDALSPGIEVADSISFAFGRERNRRNHLSDADYTLAYKRDDNGNYGLVVEAQADDTDVDGAPVFSDHDDSLPSSSTIWVRRLDQVSRPLRIASLVRLPHFIARFKTELETKVIQVAKDIGVVREAAAELKAALSGQDDIK
jgi:hypothetical protein